MSGEAEEAGDFAVPSPGGAAEVWRVQSGPHRQGFTSVPFHLLGAMPRSQDAVLEVGWSYGGGGGLLPIVAAL